jgi:hyperosmotically inducible protein
MISKLFALLMAAVLLASFCLAADKPVSDDQLYDTVRLRLADDPDVKGGALKVDVKLGVVTLSGTLDTEKQKDKAGKIAKKVKGVSQVVNNISLKEHGSSK